MISCHNSSSLAHNRMYIKCKLERQDRKFSSWSIENVYWKIWINLQGLRGLAYTYGICRSKWHPETMKMALDQVCLNM